jgi:hypothetical protein
VIETEAELRRLREGDLHEQPPADLDTLAVECPGGAEPALARVREVLEAVLERSEGQWPSLGEWKQALPAWFVEACVDDALILDCVVDKWSIRAWVYWFQPGLRKWRWWDATTSGTSLEVRVAVLERPYLRGALEWLLRASAEHQA